MGEERETWILLELRVPVSIVENAGHLIKIWKILWTGEDVAVDLVRERLEGYPNVISIGLDRGFTSMENIDKLDPISDHALCPKRGILSRRIEKWSLFQSFRSSPDACAGRVLDQLSGTAWRGTDSHQRGKEEFARTVGASVVATHLCRIGDVLMKRSQVLKAA